MVQSAVRIKIDTKMTMSSVVELGRGVRSLMSSLGMVAPFDSRNLEAISDALAKAREPAKDEDAKTHEAAKRKRPMAFCCESPSLHTLLGPSSPSHRAAWSCPVG